MQPSGLLFYNGRLNEKHDFLALELVAGQVRLTYSTGGCRQGVGGQVGACVGETGAGASPESPQVCPTAHLNTHLHAKHTREHLAPAAIPRGEVHLSKECVLLLSVQRHSSPASGVTSVCGG